MLTSYQENILAEFVCSKKAINSFTKIGRGHRCHSVSFRNIQSPNDSMVDAVKLLGLGAP